MSVDQRHRQCCTLYRAVLYINSLMQTCWTQSLAKLERMIAYCEHFSAKANNLAVGGVNLI